MIIPSDNVSIHLDPSLFTGYTSLTSLPYPTSAKTTFLAKLRRPRRRPPGDGVHLRSVGGADVGGTVHGSDDLLLIHDGHYNDLYLVGGWATPLKNMN